MRAPPCGHEDMAEIHTDMLGIQNELFVVGAELATAPEAAERLEPGVSRVTPRWWTGSRPTSTVTWSASTSRPSS